MVLSTPSLGITGSLLQRGQRRISGFRFQLPLSGSPEKIREEKRRGAEAVAFNSLSRDHFGDEDGVAS